MNVSRVLAAIVFLLLSGPGSLVEGKEFCGWTCNYFDREGSIFNIKTKKEREACHCTRFSQCATHIINGWQPGSEALARNALRGRHGIMESLMAGDDEACDPTEVADLVRMLQNEFFRTCDEQGEKVCDMLAARVKHINSNVKKPEGTAQRLVRAVEIASKQAAHNRVAREQEAALQRAKEAQRLREEAAEIKRQERFLDAQRLHEKSVRKSVDPKAIAHLATAPRLCQTTCFDSDVSVPRAFLRQIFSIEKSKEEDEQVQEGGPVGTCECRRLRKCGELLRRSFDTWVPEFAAAMTLKHDALKCQEEDQHDVGHLKALQEKILKTMRCHPFHGEIAREIFHTAAMHEKANDLLFQLDAEIFAAYGKQIQKETDREAATNCKEKEEFKWPFTAV